MNTRVNRIEGRIPRIARRAEAKRERYLDNL